MPEYNHGPNIDVPTEPTPTTPGATASVPSPVTPNDQPPIPTVPVITGVEPVTTPEPANPSPDNRPHTTINQYSSNSSSRSTDHRYPNPAGTGTHDHVVPNRTSSYRPSTRTGGVPPSGRTDGTGRHSTDTRATRTNSTPVVNNNIGVKGPVLGPTRIKRGEYFYTKFGLYELGSNNNNIILVRVLYAIDVKDAWHRLVNQGYIIGNRRIIRIEGSDPNNPYAAAAPIHTPDTEPRDTGVNFGNRYDNQRYYQ